MAVNSWARRQFANGVITTATLSGSLASGTTTTFSVGSGQGSTFPDGSVGPFIVTIALVNSALQYSNEERILCASRSGDTFTIAASGRGYNGYTALNHSGTETVLHTVDQQDFNEANQVANQTLGAIAASGDLLVGSSANTLAKLSRGSSGQILQSGASTLSWITPEGDATIATQESTASTAYTDLTTPGPAVTMTTGTKVKVTLTATVGNSTSVADACAMSVAVTGGAAASDAVSLMTESVTPANYSNAGSAVYVLSGLTAGSNTFTAKYRAVTGGTAVFSNRTLIVERLN